jgi:hypothetical protein
MKTAFVVEAVEQHRIPNGTEIEFPNGWVGLVTDQSGPIVQITYGDHEGNYLGITEVDRDDIEGRKVKR